MKIVLLENFVLEEVVVQNEINYTNLNEKDLLVMKLLHYFMTKKEYKPVIIRGIENEIWLNQQSLLAPCQCFTPAGI